MAPIPARELKEIHEATHPARDKRSDGDEPDESKREASASDGSKPESNSKDSSNGDGRDDEEPP